MRLLETVTDLESAAESIRTRRYGVVETVAGRLVAVHLRPWPKLVSLPEIIPLSWRYHARGPRNRCLLYYNQPLRHPNYLSLKYVVSTPGTTLATVRGALSVLDWIAQIKQTDALLCDVGNGRISDRVLQRWGWQAHKSQPWHRNFIKRFYGSYPDVGLPS